jgi:ectoine hydroxylase-related dioxygenase (phytanoyl-CoA dioxygenase family)
VVVITRASGYLALIDGPVPPSSTQLQSEGYALLENVWDRQELDELRTDVERVFNSYPPDVRRSSAGEEHWAPFRYEMLNRSGPVQAAVAHPRILETIEPLLGEDCHVIANTAWWQPAGNNAHGGRHWHIDSGPHIPRPAGVPWDERIPYPVFAVAAHVYLMDCPVGAGPTGVIPGSHTSGQAPPPGRTQDDQLTWNGRGAVALVAKAGDVALFVSDVWHRRMAPTADDPGRMFVQCHYGRRDLAQRMRTTRDVNHLTPEAIERAATPRARRLAGLHPPGFYDG